MKKNTLGKMSDFRLNNVKPDSKKYARLGVLKRMQLPSLGQSGYHRQVRNQVAAHLGLVVDKRST